MCLKKSPSGKEVVNELQGSVAAVPNGSQSSNGSQADFPLMPILIQVNGEVPTYPGSIPRCLSDLLGLSLIFVTGCK